MRKKQRAHIEKRPHLDKLWPVNEGDDGVTDDGAQRGLGDVVQNLECGQEVREENEGI